MGLFQVTLGPLLAVLSLFLGCFAVVLGLFWAVLDRFRSFHSYSAPLKVVLELFSDIKNRFRPFEGHFGANLGCYGLFWFI